MRRWPRLALIFWLLTGLISAPAMAFGMACHGNMNRGTTAADVSTTMPMSHASMPHGEAAPKADGDVEHKAFACAIHCLNAGAGHMPQVHHDAEPASAGGSVMSRLASSSLDGLSFGPPFEPPIPPLV